MMNLVTKVILLILLICLACRASANDSNPPFFQTYLIEAKLCPMGDGSAGIDCKTFIGGRTSSNMMCEETIQLDQPLAKTILSHTGQAFGLPTRDFKFTLTCMLVDDGERADL